MFKCAQTKPRAQTVTPGYNPYTRNRGIERDSGRIEKFLKNENLVEFGDVIRESSSTAINKKRNNVSIVSNLLSDMTMEMFLMTVATLEAFLKYCS